MADQTRMPDACPLWTALGPPLTIAAGFALSIVIAETGHGSDWLAYFIAVFCLATLQPWRPR